jgi:hypothetical protein
MDWTVILTLLVPLEEPEETLAVFPLPHATRNKQVKRHNNFFIVLLLYKMLCHSYSVISAQSASILKGRAFARPVISFLILWDRNRNGSRMREASARAQQEE